MPYLIFKLVHVAAVIIFLGNIITGLFWKAHGDRTRDPRIIANMMDGIIRADRLFTLPGVLLIIIAGFGGAGIGHLPVLRTGWIFWSIVLFTVSGLAFMFWLAPLQKKMLAVMRAGEASGKPDWDAYHRLSRQWEFWGAVALLTPLAALVLMVLKPAIRGL